MILGTQYVPNKILAEWVNICGAFVGHFSWYWGMSWDFSQADIKVWSQAGPTPAFLQATRAPSHIPFFLGSSLQKKKKKKCFSHLQASWEQGQWHLLLDPPSAAQSTESVLGGAGLFAWSYLFAFSLIYPYGAWKLFGSPGAERQRKEDTVHLMWVQIGRSSFSSQGGPQLLGFSHTTLVLFSLRLEAEA